MLARQQRGSIMRKAMTHNGLLVGFCFSVGAILTLSTAVQGHVAISSRWNYDEHLLPIFQARCGACHVTGGLAPFSLVEYTSAKSWAESIREEVLALRMPPWQAEDSFGRFRNGQVLLVNEMDMILEWSSGGSPKSRAEAVNSSEAVISEKEENAAASEEESGWMLGEPDLVLQAPRAFILAPGTSELVRFFVIPSGTDRDLWINGVDFRPGGSRPVVRSVVMYLDGTGRARELDEADEAPGFAPPSAGSFPTTPPIAVWNPAAKRVLFGENSGYRLRKGDDLVLRVHYKKTWLTVGQEFTDQSSVALYLEEDASREIESQVISLPVMSAASELTFQYTLADELTLLALLIESQIQAAQLQIEAVLPNASRQPILLVQRLDPSWPTRFWLDRPAHLPVGTQLDVRFVPDSGASQLHDVVILPGEAADWSMRLMLDYVRQ